MTVSEPNPAKLNISHRKKARALLLQGFYQWQLSGAPAAEIESQFRADNQGKIDWEFFHEVLFSVTAAPQEYDKLFTPFLDRGVEDLNPVELALLRMGVYELAKRIDVPYRVAINEAVELAKTFGATDSHKYINGVLDKAARELRAIEIQGRNRSQP